MSYRSYLYYLIGFLKNIIIELNRIKGPKIKCHETEEKTPTPAARDLDQNFHNG